MKKFNFLFLVIVLVFSMFSLLSLSQVSTPTATPPFMAHSNNFMMILFEVPKEDAQGWLPPGVRARSNEKGMVTSGLELYEVDRIAGFPKYSTAFMFIEVEGLQSNNGTPGHWAVWGKVNGEQALGLMQNTFHFPYSSDNVTISQTQNLYTGTVGESIVLKLEYDQSKPFAGEGIVNMCSMRDKKIFKTEVPWFSTGSAANLIAFDISSNDDHVLKALNGVKPFFAMISTNQTFCYSRPVGVEGIATE